MEISQNFVAFSEYMNFIIATQMYEKDAKIESLPTINGGHMSVVGHWTSLRQQVQMTPE